MLLKIKSEMQAGDAGPDDSNFAFHSIPPNGSRQSTGRLDGELGNEQDMIYLECIEAPKTPAIKKLSSPHNSMAHGPPLKIF